MESFLSHSLTDRKRVTPLSGYRRDSRRSVKCFYVESVFLYTLIYIGSFVTSHYFTVFPRIQKIPKSSLKYYYEYILSLRLNLFCRGNVYKGGDRVTGNCSKFLHNLSLTCL